MRDEEKTTGESKQDKYELIKDKIIELVKKIKELTEENKLPKKTKKLKEVIDILKSRKIPFSLPRRKGVNDTVGILFVGYNPSYQEDENKTKSKEILELVAECYPDNFEERAKLLSEIMETYFYYIPDKEIEDEKWENSRIYSIIKDVVEKKLQKKLINQSENQGVNKVKLEGLVEIFIDKIIKSRKKAKNFLSYEKYFGELYKIAQRIAGSNEEGKPKIRLWWENNESSQELVEFVDFFPVSYKDKTILELLDLEGKKDKDKKENKNNNKNESLLKQCQDLFKEVLSYYDPKIVIANGAKLYDLILKDKRANSNSTNSTNINEKDEKQDIETFKYYKASNGKEYPIFFTGFLTVAGQLDRFSKQRLINEVRIEYQKVCQKM